LLRQLVLDLLVVRLDFYQYYWAGFVLVTPTHQIFTDETYSCRSIDSVLPLSRRSLYLLNLGEVLLDPRELSHNRVVF
jgi:hypothetical protein